MVVGIHVSTADWKRREDAGAPDPACEGKRCGLRPVWLGRSQAQGPLAPHLQSRHSRSGRQLGPQCRPSRLSHIDGGSRPGYNPGIHAVWLALPFDKGDAIRSEQALYPGDLPTTVTPRRRGQLDEFELVAMVDGWLYGKELEEDSSGGKIGKGQERLPSDRREAAGMEQGPDNMELDGESDTEMQDFSFLGGDIDMPHAPGGPACSEVTYPVTYPGEGTAEISAPDNGYHAPPEAQMDPIADGMEDWDYLVEQEGPDAVYNPPGRSACAENLTDKARGIFKETGLFASFCRHSVTLVLVDMIESGESAKYGLSITCHLLAVPGKHILGYDIGCKFEQWVYEHPLVCKLAKEKGFSAVVGAFHITGHLRQCQLRNMPLYRDGMGLDAVENAENIFSKSNALAGTTRHASTFHCRQDIVNYFSHSDNFDALANIVSLIHNKYRRALEVLSKEEDLLDYMNTNNITERSVFEQWLVDEEAALQKLSKEPLEETLQMEAKLEALVESIGQEPIPGWAGKGLSSQDGQVEQAKRREEED
ncbi:hypothetical protein HMN09_00798100 [Mycena chlorophos]|uniref:Uncharacterized protein n=1 Tax=Mycena chlorophos TaxID=658473 RepID=A0A8H6WAN3_MYCCL|nr:hypothetical protein HMN09_00798100 [Mycena chlorophos]